MMYKPGELIIYGGEGVCRVVAVGRPDIQGANPDRVYYTLKPLYRDGMTYTPVDTATFMRPVISRREAEDLIEGISAIEPDPCQDRSLRALGEHYDAFFSSHRCDDLVRLIRTVYVKGQSAARQNKRLGQIDSRYMARAEDMLHGELAVALDIPKESVRAYITRRMETIQ